MTTNIILLCQNILFVQLCYLHHRVLKPQCRMYSQNIFPIWIGITASDYRRLPSHFATLTCDLHFFCSCICDGDSSPLPGVRVYNRKVPSPAGTLWREHLYEFQLSWMTGHGTTDHHRPAAAIRFCRRTPGGLEGAHRRGTRTGRRAAAPEPPRTATSPPKPSQRCQHPHTSLTPRSASPSRFPAGPHPG